jgi:UDP-2-acetamido-2-deoxy-ribo-hexuluronate aminotransferase
MVDLHSQYLRIRPEIDQAMQSVLDATDFIQGKAVREFEEALAHYMGGISTVTCGNGTDALQIAMMALSFKPGDEIILPVHTYVATAEVIALLQLVPVFADVDENTFTIDASKVEKLITRKTVAIVPVHLYGQCADMESIAALANRHKLYVIEDAAQSLGAEYVYLDGTRKRAGTMGAIGTSSFFPSKNLGAFGDGGVLFTNDTELADRIRMIANHGQKKKYHHQVIGVNSRLDTLQASILKIKLRYLDEYAGKRAEVAAYYDKNLAGLDFLTLPQRFGKSTHVFHQYTVKIQFGKRDNLRSYLEEKGIPTMIYYPIPLHLQEAYKREGFGPGSFPVTEKLSATVLSLPIHTEMETDQLAYICDSIKGFKP